VNFAARRGISLSTPAPTWPHLSGSPAKPTKLFLISYSVHNESCELLAEHGPSFASISRLRTRSWLSMTDQAPLNA